MIAGPGRHIRQRPNNPDDVFFADDRRVGPRRFQPEHAADMMVAGPGKRAIAGSVRPVMSHDEKLNESLPGGELSAARMPGHWLLARMGKRVLRPGGLELTRRMLEALDIQPSDAVVELAPGLGVTAKLTLSRRPASYTAIERDEAAAQTVRRYLTGPQCRCLVGLAEDTGLPGLSATVVYGEAMLSMQAAGRKALVTREAFRLLRPGGRYGIHELCVVPDDIDELLKHDIQKELTQAIHHGVQPLPRRQWRDLLASEGFIVRDDATAPMHLLEPARLIRDEGIRGSVRFARNLLLDRQARRRVLAMRRVFRRYDQHLAAIMLVGVKPDQASQ